jgi:hypothetical protein
MDYWGENEEARQEQAFADAAQFEKIVENALGFKPAAREAAKPPKVRKAPKILRTTHAAQEAAKPAAKPAPKTPALETKPTGRKLLGGNPAGRQKAPKSHDKTHRAKR